MITLLDEITCVADVLAVMDALRNDVASENCQFCHSIDLEAFPYGLWFRGEISSDKPLTPSIFRRHNHRDNLVEPSLSNHIQTRIPDLYKIPNPFDKLCLAQHYDIPTRLLDWTESILFAAYFAVASGGDNWEDVDGELTILNAYTLNTRAGQGIGKGRIHVSEDFGTQFRAHMSFAFNASDWAGRVSSHCPTFSWNKLIEEDEEYRNKYSYIKPDSGQQCRYYQSPVAVVPARINQRMIIQGSVFTLHGGSLSWPESDDCKPVPIPNKLKFKDGKEIPVYHTIKVPKKTKAKFKKELFGYGIHKGTLFPEMDKQFEYLTTIW